MDKNIDIQFLMYREYWRVIGSIFSSFQKSNISYVDIISSYRIKRYCARLIYVLGIFLRSMFIDFLCYMIHLYDSYNV